MDSEDKQKQKSVWRWVPSIPISAVYGGAKNVATAGSQGTLDFTKYCGNRVLWIGSKCAQTAMSALSSGGKAVESAHSLGIQSLSVSCHYGKTALSTLSPGTQYVKIPFMWCTNLGKALVVEGYKSGIENAIHYGNLGYNSVIGGYIGVCLGPIVGFSLERAVLSSIPAPVDGAFSLMTPSVKSMIGPALTTGMNAGLGAMGDSLKQMTTNLVKSLKITQGTKVGDVWMMRAVVYAYVGKGCGHVIGGGLGAAGGFVIGGIGGVSDCIRKGLEKACKDPFVTQHPDH